MNFADDSIKSFLHEVASKPYTPAGGSIAAMCAAAAAALTQMVIARTINKKDDSEMKEMLQKCLELRKTFLHDMDLDAKAYMKVVESKDNYKESITVPLQSAKRLVEMLEIIKVVLEKGNEKLITDTMEAFLIAKAAVQSLIHHIKFNLSSVNDKEYISKVSVEVEYIEGCMKENIAFSL